MLGVLMREAPSTSACFMLAGFSSCHLRSPTESKGFASGLQVEALANGWAAQSMGTNT
jgi:hypothetical protein